MTEVGLGESLASEAAGGKRTDSRQHTRISVSGSGSVRVRTTGKHTRVSVSDSDAVRIRIAGGTHGFPFQFRFRVWFRFGVGWQERQQWRNGLATGGTGPAKASSKRRR
jgi:hypothetical protein